MKVITGTSNKVLEVDLSSGESTLFEVTQRHREAYLGGKGLGLRYLYDRLAPGTDPLGPENVIIFMPGILMGTGAPCSSRFHALSKSPLTGIITSSSCGGPFGLHLKTAGYDGLIIKGRASTLVCLEIDERGARIKEVPHLKGKGVKESQGLLGARDMGDLTIGPAGENQVRIANIASGHRFLGRGGLGAVMGSKNLKAILVKGGAYKIEAKEKTRFQKIREKALKYLRQNEMTSYLYREFGTRTNILLNNLAGILPVRNFQEGRDPRAYEISGEEFKDLHRVTPNPCKGCVILCGQKGKFGNSTLAIPEYETVALMGSNLGIYSREYLAKVNALVNDLGMDTISLGNILGWCMEATEKGLFSSPLRFGSTEGIQDTIKAVADNTGIGQELGQGVRYLARKYGGRDFAMEVKGLELAGYDPRGSYGQGLSFAVANRGGCHLSAFLVALEVYFNLLDPYSPHGKAAYVKFFEDLTCCINSLITCQFTMFAYLMEPPLTKYTPKTLLKQLMQRFPSLSIPLIDYGIYRDLWRSVLGIDISKRDFLRAGQRIHDLERYMNLRDGITHEEDTLPPRILYQHLAPHPHPNPLPLNDMLREYYKIRGYDPSGCPLPNDLLL